MTNEILIFRTDRIGDLLLTCPSIKTIKENYPDSNLNIVTSEKNFYYAKTFEFFDEVYLCPKGSFLKKIKLFFELYKKKFDYIFIFDSKGRSFLFSCFLRSKKKAAKIVSKKQAFICKLFNIKFSYDILGKDLNNLHQNLLNYSNINIKIENFDYLLKKNHNNFVSKIPLENFIQIHLDEKWFSSTYIKNYIDINPSFEEFTNFIKSLSKNNNVLITTGLLESNLFAKLLINSTEKNDKNIYISNANKNIVIVKKATFIDLESILRKTKVLITCHGAITHAAASFNIKIIDIIEKEKEKFDSRCTSYIKNYHTIYRSSFNSIKDDIYKKILLTN